MNLSQLAVLLGIATVANSHGIMVEPRPYNLHTAPLQQVAPLSAELPFPCQGRTEHAGDRTTLTAGDCPAKAAGNLQTIEKDADGRENGPQCGNVDGEECVRQFDIPIPKGIKNSDKATFAFTWFNKIGNREMYMTCAPVNIVDGTDDKALMDSLPPVFQANIPGQCTTGESGQLLNIPNPGKFGKVNAQPSPRGNGACPAADAPSFVESPQRGGDTPSQGGDPKGAPQPSSSSLMTMTTLTRSTASTQPTTANGSQPSAGTTTSQAAPAETSQPSWAVGMKPCQAPDNTIFCFENNTFGLCTEGWAQPIPLNEDQICKNGEITYKFSASSSA